MKIAFLFSGQGAQHSGMMQDISAAYSASNHIFETASNVLGRDIKELSFYGTEEELCLTHNTQPCVLAADLAAAEALKANGVFSQGVAGFSLGEYSALVEAKVISLEDAFRIIQVRADAMQEAVPLGEGKMAAFMGVTSDAVVEICKKVKDDYVIASNYNSPSQTVVSGTASGVDKAVSIAKEVGIKSITLPVSAPFHCELMRPAAERVKECLMGKKFNKSVIPTYMNISGLVLEEEENLPQILYQQAMSPVFWTQTMQNMYNDGFDVFVECGPGKTLSGLAKKTLDMDKAKVFRVSDLKSLNQTVESIKELACVK